MVLNNFNRNGIYSYKLKLIEEREASESNIALFSFSLQKRLDKYYTALNGKYRYIDKHTGKTVHARTYRKRLAFAEEELEGIRREIQLSRRYGKIDDNLSLFALNYTSSLYNTAVTNNKYAKKKKIGKTNIASRLRYSLNSLENNIIDLPTSNMISITRHNSLYPLEAKNEEFVKQIVSGLHFFKSPFINNSSDYPDQEIISVRKQMESLNSVPHNLGETERFSRRIVKRVKRTLYLGVAAITLGLSLAGYKMFLDKNSQNKNINADSRYNNFILLK